MKELNASAQLSFPRLAKEHNAEEYIVIDDILQLMKNYQIEIDPALVRGVRSIVRGGFSTEAKNWLLKAASNYSSQAITLLGQYNFNKALDNHKDQKLFSESVKWLCCGAKLNNAHACSLLGVCCLLGLGIERSYAQAYKYFLKAATMREPNAQYGLYLCYKNGYGVSQDNARAFQWLNLAIENGFDQESGLWQRGICYLRGMGVKQDLLQSLKLLEAAYTERSKYGVLVAANICKCYEIMIGVCEDASQKYNLIKEYYKWLYQKSVSLCLRIYKKRPLVTGETLNDFVKFLETYFQTPPPNAEAISPWLTALYEFISKSKYNQCSATTTDSRTYLDYAHIVLMHMILNKFPFKEKSVLSEHIKLVDENLSAAFGWESLDSFMSKLATCSIDKGIDKDYSTIIDADSAAKIASFLELKEMLCLSAANTRWHQIIAKHDIRYGICREINTRYNSYSATTYYPLQAFIECGLVALCWYGSDENVPAWGRLAAVLLACVVILLGRKNYATYQKYNQVSLFKCDRYNAISTVVDEVKPLLVTICSKLAAIVNFGTAVPQSMLFNPKVSQDLLLEWQNKYKELANDLRITKMRIEKLNSLLFALEESCPTRVIELLAADIKNKLTLLLNLRANQLTLLFRKIDSQLAVLELMNANLSEIINQSTSMESNCSSSSSRSTLFSLRQALPQSSEKVHRYVLSFNELSESLLQMQNLLLQLGFATEGTNQFSDKGLCGT